MGLEWNQVHYYCGHLLAYYTKPWILNADDCGVINEINERQGKRKYSEETCSSVALSTTEPTWLDPVLNPDSRGGNRTTDRLSYIDSLCRQLPVILEERNLCSAR
jgi:hypothetical protein